MNGTCPSNTQGHYIHFKRTKTKIRLWPLSPCISPIAEDLLQGLHMTGESNGPLVTAQLALGLPELWDETDV